MKKIFFLCFIVFLSFNLKAQLFIGSNFNVTNSYTPKMNFSHHFSIPFGAELGYNFNSPIKLKLSGFIDQYTLIDNSEQYFYQFPITLSKTINQENTPTSYNLGIIYSTSFIQTRENHNDNFNNSIVSGPGFNVSINFSFKKYSIEIGALNTYEMFGDAKSKRLSSIFFISHQLYFGKYKKQ